MGTITWSNCRLCCRMNFKEANCMTSLLHCLIHSQAFRLMELYWFVSCEAQLSLPLMLCLFYPGFISSLKSSSSMSLYNFHHFPPIFSEAQWADQHLLHVAPWWGYLEQHQHQLRRADVCLHARRPDCPRACQKRPDSHRPSLCSLQGWISEIWHFTTVREYFKQLWVGVGEQKQQGLLKCIVLWVQAMNEKHLFSKTSAGVDLVAISRTEISHLLPDFLMSPMNGCT